MLFADTKTVRSTATKSGRHSEATRIDEARALRQCCLCVPDNCRAMGSIALT